MAKGEKIPTLFLKENLGFAGGVNAGLKEVNTEYVILLNNDTEVFPDYIEELVKAIKKSKKIFSVSPMMIQSMNRDLMDDAGDGMCILGWGYQIGVGERFLATQGLRMFLRPVQVRQSIEKRC